MPGQKPSYLESNGREKLDYAARLAEAVESNRLADVITILDSVSDPQNLINAPHFKQTGNHDVEWEDMSAGDQPGPLFESNTRMSERFGIMLGRRPLGAALDCVFFSPGIYDDMVKYLIEHDAKVPTANAFPEAMPMGEPRSSRFASTEAEYRDFLKDFIERSNGEERTARQALLKDKLGIEFSSPQDRIGPKNPEHPLVNPHPGARSLAQPE